MSKKPEIEYVWQDRKRTFLGLPWSFTKYFLTNTKFITRPGFFNLDEDELDLYKVTDKKLKLPFWQRLVGCGTVILYVRDTDTPEKEVRCIKQPRQFLAMLDKQIDAERDRYNTRGRDLYAITGGMGHHGHMHHDDMMDHPVDDAADDDYFSDRHE